MAGNKIKFQVFLDDTDAEKIKSLAYMLGSSGLDGSVSETIRYLVKKGLIQSDLNQCSVQ